LPNNTSLPDPPLFPVKKRLIRGPAWFRALVLTTYRGHYRAVLSSEACKLGVGTTRKTETNPMETEAAVPDSVIT
jgi:hypothetical protein